VAREFPGPRVIVTHDVVDAFVLGDRIVVIESGRVVQQGTAAAIGSQPRSRYVADLVGLNFLRGEVHDSVFHDERGARLVVASAHTGSAVATVHPRAIALFAERPSGSPRNVWPAVVAAVEPALTGCRAAGRRDHDRGGRRTRPGPGPRGVAGVEGDRGDGGAGVSEVTSASARSP
jgi:ABC-type sulfate/molybdate transport systems ATPase subunit